MDQGNDSKKPEVKVVVVQQAGGMYHTYSNHVSLSWTAHDVKVEFADITRLPEFMPSDIPTNRIEQRATISMSWSEVKSLLGSLGELINRFESVNGEIKQPKVP